jgi:Tat protein secretion system quality control protein TatD with DNase activity
LYLSLVAQRIAELKQTGIEEVVQQTTKNALSLVRMIK